MRIRDKRGRPDITSIVWIEAIFERGDLARLLEELMPLTIDLGDDGDLLALGQPKNVAFVAGQGLRLECEAKVRWSVLGIDVPITIHEVRAILRPEIVRPPEGGSDVLVFRLFIEHADVAGLPTVVDEHLTDKVNAVLEARHLESSIDLSRLLGGSFQLPPSMRPLASMSLEVAWAKIRITDEAMVMAVSLHATVARGDSSVADPPPVAEPPDTPDTAALLVRGGASTGTITRRRTRLAALGALAGGSMALALAGVYGVYRIAVRRARL